MSAWAKPVQIALGHRYIESYHWIISPSMHRLHCTSLPRSSGAVLSHQIKLLLRRAERRSLFKKTERVKSPWSGAACLSSGWSFRAKESAVLGLVRQTTAVPGLVRQMTGVGCVYASGLRAPGACGRLLAQGRASFAGHRGRTQTL